MLSEIADTRAGNRVCRKGVLEIQETSVQLGVTRSVSTAESESQRKVALGAEEVKSTRGEPAGPRSSHVA